MYLNEKEEKIIGQFINVADEYMDEILLLKWTDGSCVYAKYDSPFEDSVDLPPGEQGYEEFWSLIFKALSRKGNPPIHISEHNLFLIDYRNFPNEILANGKKIN